MTKDKLLKADRDCQNCHKESKCCYYPRVQFWLCFKCAMKYSSSYIQNDIDSQIEIQKRIDEVGL